MSAGVSARISAAELVGRVDREGAWSNVVTRDVAGVDAALVRHLVYGVTRHRGRIDRVIEAYASRPFGTITPEVLDVLRVGVHEILFSRTPDHAAVDTAVQAVRARTGAKATGFVNAVLRAVVTGGEPTPPETLADELGLPQWMLDDLETAWGKEEAETFARQSNSDAALWVRMRDGSGDGQIPGTAQVSNVPAGAVVQDPASVAVALAVGAESGDRVLEVGAAPGGKSLALSDMGASVTAVDAHKRRTKRGARRTAAENVVWVLADGRRLPFTPETFDRVLLDAPCTGLGTLRRRPEIKYKATAGERDRLAALQAELLEAAVTMVRPGGRLIYAVCTVTPAETEGIARRVDGQPPVGLPGRHLEHGLLMAPHLTGTDGMYVSVIDR